MMYEKPEVAVLGLANEVIQGHKPNFGEPTLSDPRSNPDTELAD